MKKILSVALAAWLGCSTSVAQVDLATISYSLTNRSETVLESFMIIGPAVEYTVNYIGKKGSTQTDSKKKCRFSVEEMKQVEKLVKERRLDITDSLNIESDTKPFQLVNIYILVVKNGKMSTVTVMAHPNDVKNKSLYKNSMSLLGLMRRMMKDCQ